MCGDSLTYLHSSGSFLSRMTLFAFLTLEREHILKVKRTIMPLKRINSPRVCVRG